MSSDQITRRISTLDVVIPITMTNSVVGKRKNIPLLIVKSVVLSSSTLTIVVLTLKYFLLHKSQLVVKLIIMLKIVVNWMAFGKMLNVVHYLTMKSKIGKIVVH